MLLITNRNVYTHFRLVPKSITLDDRERINGRFRINISSEMAIFSLFTQKNMSQTINNIRPRTLLTINRKSTSSIDELIRQGSLYMHCCGASPMHQLGFLVRSSTLSHIYLFIYLHRPNKDDCKKPSSQLPVL